MSLKQRTFASIRWTSLGSLLATAIQMAQIATLARLLSKEDYGLSALVTVVLSYATLFADFGLNSAFIQSQNVSQEQRSSLYWFNIAIGCSLGLLVLVLCPFTELLFGDHRLTGLLALSALSFPLSALGSQIRTAAAKSLQFGSLVGLEFAASVVGLVTSLIFAGFGFGAYAIVLGGLASAAWGALHGWWFLSDGWRPNLRFRWSDVRPFLGFGGALVANNFVNNFNATIDLVLGGKLLPLDHLGSYSVPKNLSLKVQRLINPIITRVGFPVIASIQNDLEKVRRIYLKTMSMTASANAPIYLGVAFFSAEFTDVLLGDRWHDSSRVLGILAIWGLIRSMANPVGSLLLGMGKANLSLTWNLCLLLVLPPSIFVGSYYGIEGIASSLMIVQLVLFIPVWRFLVYPLCQAPFVAYAMSILRPTVLAILAIGLSHFLVEPIESTLVRLFSGVFLSASAYAVLSYFFNREFLTAILELAGSKRR